MKQPAQGIRYFLFSQYLSDGLRITLEIVMPAVIFSLLGRLDVGLLISTGALCVSISDAPGPVEHKRNGMLYCNGFVFIMSLLTGFANHSIWVMGFLLLLASFFFTMFTVFGTRASAVGIAALLIMILRMDKELPAGEVLTESLLILSGGIWYMLLALLFFWAWPLRQAQRSLGNCIHETSKLLLIKATLYDPQSDIKTAYQKLLAQQVIVNEKQDEVRELLFKDKQLVKDTTRTGQAILITFTAVVDLYDQITATWYDYAMLREKFADTGVLPQIAELVKEMALELDRTGLAIQSNIAHKKQFELAPAVLQLKAAIDAAALENTSNLVLKKILVNFRNLGEQIDAIHNYFSADIDLKSHRFTKNYYSKFISHQEISFAVFRDNMSLNASIFRHSLRMMITSVAGLVIVKFISYGHHSYWILLTIVFILKPGYSITKQRNLQRIAGTVAGGVVGIALILLVKNHDVLFGFIIFFMIGTYTFQRINYVITVLFMTPYILILFSLLGMGFIAVAQERVLDTAIASVLAFLASYFLFPHWESNQLDTYMASVLKANIKYLQQLQSFFSGNSSLLEYKLARKELYVSTANLSAAFTRMMSEPKAKQQNAPVINEVVILNNVLSSNIASLFTINIAREQPSLSKEIMLPLQRSVMVLEESLVQIDNLYQAELTLPGNIVSSAARKIPDLQIKDHVDFIYKLTLDIRKIIQQLTSKN